jgi:glycosyltransferase involved in cell wall biosynthesis
MLLTIAIPTYNRATYLGETLDRILVQLPKDSSDQVEILVADNASTDGTETVCHRRAQDNHGIVRYLRHAENQGFDRNLDSLFVAARGEYLLLIGDDDYPLPGAIDRIWGTLHRSSNACTGLIYCYHKLIDGKTETPCNLDEAFFRTDDLGGDDITVYRSGVDLLRTRGTTLHAGLTGMVLLRNAWLESDRDHFFGTNFIHLAVAYQVAARYQVCVDRWPSFMVRQFGEHRWPTNGELYFGLLKAGRPLSEDYPKDIVSRVRRKQDWEVRRAIVSYRAAAPRDQRLVEVIQDSLDKGRIGYWLIDRPLLTVPGKVLTMIMNVARFFRGHANREVE